MFLSLNIYGCLKHWYYQQHYNQQEKFAAPLNPLNSSNCELKNLLKYYLGTMCMVCFQSLFVASISKKPLLPKKLFLYSADLTQIFLLIL